MTDDKGLGLKSWLLGPKKTGPEAEAKKPAAHLDRHRLAVLPFANMSPNSHDEYFADGMMEEIITRLSGLEGLRVIARTSAMKYKGARKSVLEIGSELQAGSALEGSIRKSGERLRITVQLVDASTEEHLWANSYDRNMTDVFAVQTDIAENVARSLEIKLLADNVESIQRLGTRSLAAYIAYLKGRELLSKRSKEGMLEAKKQFESAIAEDPGFARAYAGLADWTMVGEEVGVPYMETLKKARPLVNKALELDNNSAEAHASMGLLLRSLYDWKGAEQELKRAVNINPSYADAHKQLALVLAALGKTDEMLRQITVAMDLDPLSAAVTSAAGFTYSLAGKYSEALSCWERARELSPDFQWVRVLQSYAMIELGRADEGVSLARDLVHESPTNSDYLGILAYSLARTGKLDEARELLKQLDLLKRQSKAVAQGIWYAYVPAGDFDKAFELVSEALETRELDPAWLRSPFHVEKLHSDSRYARLIKKYNMEF